MSRVFLNAGDLVDVAAAASINSLAEVTYCGWYKAAVQPVGDYEAFWVKDPNGEYNGQWITFGVDISKQSIYTSYPFPGSESSTADFSQPLNVWYHIAFTFSNSGDKLIREYVNAVEMPYSGQQTGQVTDDSAGDLFVGNDSLGAPAKGKMYDFRVYNVALSASQILSIIHGGSPALANLKCQLTFETDQGSPEPDESGNGNVGVIVGAAFSADNPPSNPVPVATSHHAGSMETHQTDIFVLGPAIINTSKTRSSTIH